MRHAVSVLVLLVIVFFLTFPILLTFLHFYTGIALLPSTACFARHATNDRRLIHLHYSRLPVGLGVSPVRSLPKLTHDYRRWISAMMGRKKSSSAMDEVIVRAASVFRAALITTSTSLMAWPADALLYGTAVPQTSVVLYYYIIVHLNQVSAAK